MDRWQRVKEAFQAAAGRPVETRDAFLDEICGDDLAFRQEVEALLRAHDQVGSFLASPVLADQPDAGAPPAVTQTLATGTRLGPYEIEARICKGGMGEVYRARDTRLERVVAIKVLPAHVAQHPDVRQRFEREAKAISALNHPHICVLYDIGHQDGIDYLVMEYLEGESLADRLEKGALPLEQVLGYGFQIAQALDSAHRQGIVHRDLKPANVMLTKSGAKLLDFGLAKLRPTAAHSRAFEPNTLTAEHKPLTEQGTIMGTFPYMAPEQLEGREPDARTDIFALGATLYEMATGQRAFIADSQAGLIAAILSSHPPPISRFQRLAPPVLDRVVATCLAKDPDDRWQSAHDLARELKWIAEAGSQAGIPAPIVARRRSRERLAWTISGVACALLGIALLYPRQRPGQPLQVRLQISPPENAVFPWWNLPAVSPDGEHIVFSASAVKGDVRHLYVRSLSSVTAREVPGSEGAYWAFWSPDGRHIGFFGQGGKLIRIDPSDESGQTREALYDKITGGLSAYSGASWSKEGTIIFSIHGELLQMMASGGEAKPLGTRAEGETGRYWPQFLPDGRHYLYFSRAARPENEGIYVASLDSGDRKRILASDSNASYSPSGHLLFVRVSPPAERDPRGGVLMAQAFDAKRLELSGNVFPVAERVALFTGGLEGAAYSVSSNGVLAWRTGSVMARRQLTWFDRSGNALGTLGVPADYSNPALSPDERRLAVDRRNPGSSGKRDIWIFDLAPGTTSRDPTRLTSDVADDFNPTWSPDGTRIAFNSNRRGVREIYQKLANGSGDDELLLESKDYPKLVDDWSADGKLLLYDYWTGGKPSDLFLLPLSRDDGRRPNTFLANRFVEEKGQFAPNGRWIAYCSQEFGEGRKEVYVRSVSTGGAKKVSTNGGDEPRWRRDGKELFFFSGSTLSGATLMAVDVKTDGPSFDSGVPKPLLEVRLPLEGVRRRFVVTRDGQRFLVNTALEEAIEPIQVLVNWLPAKRELVSISDTR